MAEYPASGDRLATVFGGSGFIGRYIVRAFAHAGWRVRVAVRRPDLAGFLRTYGAVGQVEPMQANVRYPASVEAAVEGAEVVVNACGVQREAGRQSFDAVHARGSEAIGAAAKAGGARRWSTSPGSAPMRLPQTPISRAKGAARAPCAPPFPRRRSCAPPSCSAPRTSSSTASPRSPACSRCCRRSRKGRPRCSRSMSPTSPSSPPRRSTAP